MKKNLLLLAALVATPALASAQVLEWSVAKGPRYDQIADNTQPGSASEWLAFVYVDMTNIGDATSATISGGGLGTVPLTQYGFEWADDISFPTQAAMNAVVPSSTTYTLTLSGGSLGTLTQQFQLGAEQYPNVPFVTGTVFTDLQALNSSQPFTLNWNDPGPLTAASGTSLVEVYDFFDNEVFYDETSGTSSTIPAGTLFATQSYVSQVGFTNETSPSGAGGFGVNGRVGHINLTTLSITTIDAAQLATRNGGTNPMSYTASTPVLGNLWTGVVDLTTTGHSMARIVMHRNPATFTFGTGQTVLVSGPRVLKLPLMSGPQATWAAVLPNDVSLSGLTFYTQALHLLGVSPFALSNAQDLTFGS